MDVDNDTDLDLFVTEHDFLSPYGENYLYENHGPEASFAFEPFGTEVYDTDYLNSHVVASADFDRNGWIDFVMHNIGNHVVRIWMNGGFDNGFESVGIALGTLSNRPAIGSQIDLVTESTVQSRIVHAGENYLSQENEVELFGLEDQVPQEGHGALAIRIDGDLRRDHPWLDRHGATCCWKAIRPALSPRSNTF